jgi:hypothetical protein
MCSNGQKHSQWESKIPTEQTDLNMQQDLYPTFTFLKKKTFDKPRCLQGQRIDPSSEELTD